MTEQSFLKESNASCLARDSSEEDTYGGHSQERA